MEYVKLFPSASEAVALKAVPVADSETLTVFEDVNVGAVFTAGGVMATGVELLPPPPPQADKAKTERGRKVRRDFIIG